MTSRKRPKLVLAIYFQTKGFGFRAPGALVLAGRLGHAGGASDRDREKRCLKHIDALLKLHTPDVLVLQDTSKTGTRRAPRIQALNRRTLELAKRRGVPVRTYSREAGSRLFRGVSAPRRSSSIAETIAEHIPVLSLYVPPPRKPWKTADPRMGIFEAAALACTHLQSSGGAPPFLSQYAARANRFLSGRSVI